MGLSRVLGFCAAFLLAAPVSAAVTIDLGPSDWRRWPDGSFHHNPSGLNARVGQTVRMPPLNTNLTVTRNPVIPYGGIVNGLKQFVRVNPASIAASGAVTALFLAVDWVFDEARGEWVKYYQEEIENPDFGLWSSSHYPGKTWPTAESACRDIVEHLSCSYPSCGFYQYRGFEIWSGGTGGACLAWNPAIGSVMTHGNIQRAAECPPETTFDYSLGACVAGMAPLPLTPADWAELEAYLPSAPADVVGTAAGDAMKRQGAPLSGYSDLQIEGPSSVSGPETTSTSTDPVTGETVVTTSQTTTNISYGDTTITTTNVTTTNTYNNGVHTGSETITETPGELPVTPSEWPGFCEWASIVCDWIDWTREEPDPEPDLPEVMDDDFYEQKSIQFGSKTCPPDYEINIAFLDTTVGVSMQPLCDFAGIIYYMVMAAAYIIAAYISIGVARNG